MKHALITFTASALLTTTVFVSGCIMASDPVVDDSRTSRKLERMERPRGERPVVTIYQFTSGVSEVSAGGATDMFTSALIKSGAFAVAERNRLETGVAREKQLNAQGMSTGDASQHQLAGARYIFEGTVTEANAGKNRSGMAGSVSGVGVETKGEKASIGIDVRVIDARNGLVLDSINVRKAVKQRGTSISGITSFLKKTTKLDVPDGTELSYRTEAKEGVDEALRQCIEEAVYQLANRFGG